MHFADNSGPDQPARMRRMIRAYVVRLQNQWILSYLSTKRQCQDQTAWMHMFVWTIAVRIWHKGLFPTLRIVVAYLSLVLGQIGMSKQCRPKPDAANNGQQGFPLYKQLWTITKTCLYNFDPLKPHSYTVKLGFTGVYIIFHISAQNVDCGYSLEPPRRGGSNEYPQSMFWAEIWKISEFLSENFQFFW